MRTSGYILSWLRDSAIGFVLLTLGAALPGLLGRLFGEQNGGWFVLYFAIGMTPFFWFARRRQVTEASWWGYLAAAAVLTGIFWAQGAVEANLGKKGFLFFVILVATVLGWAMKGRRDKG
jgi:hypothetical protein